MKMLEKQSIREDRDRQGSHTLLVGIYMGMSTEKRLGITRQGSVSKKSMTLEFYF